MEPTQVVGFDENAATQAFPSSPSRENELETNATQTMVIGQTGYHNSNVEWNNSRTF